MTKKDTIVKFDISAMTVVQEEGKNFIFEPAAEDALLNWIEFKRRVEEADALVKEMLSAEMDKLNIKRIDGDGVRATKRVYGGKYQITDPEIAEALGVVKVSKTVRPDTKVIEQMAEETGSLPEGVELRERSAQVSISLLDK